MPYAAPKGLNSMGLVGEFFFFFLLLFPPSRVIGSEQSRGGEGWESRAGLRRRSPGRGLSSEPPMGDDIEWLDLPGRWTYGVCGDGRIFFIEYGPA